MERLSTSVYTGNSNVVWDDGSYGTTTTTPTLTNSNSTLPSVSFSSTGGHQATITTPVAPAAIRDDHRIEEATCGNGGGRGGGD